ncbi:BlaI/MecI/CopY family transcriptional regulator [Edaphobacter aggregans]|uniref:BlaI/MecI/CopY family transcriptional regulator n=1 Tax=Edaphobacter aggregans TaxID=570835 RepID=UPI000553BA7F|nr:BlaI/MecI/CopY family transcriptional regulator [Edaphobacter aggregans]
MSDQPKLSKLEFRVMEFLWRAKEASIREITEGLTVGESTQRSLAYTTVQTVVYRLEEKGVVRRSGKVGNFHIFAPIVSRDKAQRRLLDELMGFFGGKGKLVMAHLIETGELTLDDVKEAEDLLKQSRRRRKSE